MLSVVREIPAAKMAYKELLGLKPHSLRSPFMFHLCFGIFTSEHSPYQYSAVDEFGEAGLASFPGPRRGGEKGLVSTVCACA